MSRLIGRVHRVAPIRWARTRASWAVAALWSISPWRRRGSASYARNYQRVKLHMQEDRLDLRDADVGEDLALVPPVDLGLYSGFVLAEELAVRDDRRFRRGLRPALWMSARSVEWRRRAWADQRWTLARVKTLIGRL
ncbi:hypothetical protein [Streptomyces zaomyceticus]|uniref:hypothetical protein n=1 Tax=Streptomyces zaomyceticus TaxID=68286 RepID=UPI00342334BD